MEWFREPGNRKQAEFAFHAGRALVDYLSLTADWSPERRDEASLTVCVLQSLLTNCTELLATMEEYQRSFFEEVISDEKPVWGLRKSHIKENSFPGEPTLASVLTHLRDGLSHPTVAEPTVNCPATGYTTTDDRSGIVSAFRITDSPWVKDGNRLERISASTEKGAIANVRQQEKRFEVTGFLEVLPQPDGSFDIGRHGRQYWPLFVIELPLQAMVDLASGLANRLAQPSDERWDGRTLRELVAASP